MRFGNGKQVQMEICLITPAPESDNGHEIHLKPIPAVSWSSKQKTKKQKRMLALSTIKALKGGI